jgi:hypothetical protein
MLKKLLTGCLIIVAAAALAVPVMAAEMTGKAGGRAVAELISYSQKKTKNADTTAYLEMQAQGRLDYTLTAKEGDWTVSGKTELRSGTGAKAGTDVQVLQKFITVGNEAFSASFGTQWWGFVYLTPFVGQGDAIDRHCYGCGYGYSNYYAQLGYAPANAIEIRDDRLIIDIKSVGLKALVQMNYENGDATTDQLNETAFGLQYNGAFGPVKVAAAYVSKGTKANDKASEKTAADGYSFTSMALAVQYGITEAMFVEVDYESEASKSGISGAKEDTATVMGLAFAMALSENTGFMAAYDTYSLKHGDNDALPVNRITVDFQQKIAGQLFWAGYSSSSASLSKLDVDYSDSTIALGARVNF